MVYFDKSKSMRYFLVHKSLLKMSLFIKPLHTSSDSAQKDHHEPQFRLPSGTTKTVLLSPKSFVHVVFSDIFVPYIGEEFQKFDVFSRSFTHTRSSKSGVMMLIGLPQLEDFFEHSLEATHCC